MSSKQPFIPGFETADKAREAGRKFFKKMNGKLGVEGADFHLTRNVHDRWQFAEGRPPAEVEKVQLRPTSAENGGGQAVMGLDAPDAPDETDQEHDIPSEPEAPTMRFG